MGHDFKEVRNTSFGRLVNLIANQLSTEMNNRLAEHGLTIKLFGVLMILLDEDGITQIEISNRVGIQGYATSRTLDKLEELGFVKRHSDPNSRRSFLIQLTDEGRSTGKKLPGLIAAVNQNILAPLSTEEQQSLIASLQKVAFQQ